MSSRSSPRGGEQPCPTPEQARAGMLVNEISKLFHNRIRVACDRLGIPDGYQWPLIQLAREDGLPQQLLAQRTHRKAPTISVTLHRMEEEGLVVRRPDERDQRQIRVYLTQQGREMDRQIRAQVLQLEEQLMAGFSPQEEEILRQYLLRLRRNLLQEQE